MITFRDIQPVLAKRAGLITKLAMLQRQSPIDTRAGEVEKVRNELDRLDNTDLELLIKELK
ncbi:hypothetical protein Phage2-1_00100 [Achromobacter phage 2-1]|nr:hypothetical protein Phage2-1_00100 [Achromobacter phage 2-1]